MLKRVLHTIIALTTLTITTLDAAPKPDTSIFLNSLPQAIDLYPVYTLTGFYQLETFRVSDKTFPIDTIYTDAFGRLLAHPESYLNSGSVPATQANIDLLTRLGKVLLLVRDPRDALVSWMDYTDLQRNKPKTLSLIYPPPPAEYFTWSPEKKADWQIEHYYTYAMTWLDQWAAFITSNPKLQVLVTHFEDMATQPLDVFKEIVAFYGTDPTLFNQSNVLSMTREQYRQNEQDIGQWKNRLTVDQQARVTQMLNADTARVFNWVK
jgi:hypothetical protein